MSSLPSCILPPVDPSVLRLCLPVSRLSASPIVDPSSASPILVDRSSTSPNLAPLPYTSSPRRSFGPLPPPSVIRPPPPSSSINPPPPPTSPHSHTCLPPINPPVLHLRLPVGPSFASPSSSIGPPPPLNFGPLLHHTRRSFVHLSAILINRSSTSPSSPFVGKQQVTHRTSTHKFIDRGTNLFQNLFLAS